MKSEGNRSELRVTAVGVLSLLAFCSPEAQSSVMRARLLIDNWTLQQVGRVLRKGFSGETAHDLQLSKNGQGFKYAEVLEDLVSIECLFQLLNNIIFADELLVDKKFVSTWEQSKELAPLRQEGVVIAKPFYDLADKWIPAREVIARDLCVCPRMRRLHEQNEKQYREDKTVVDPMLSQLVWGGAGYLARSNFLKTPYVGHPLRERLFMRAAFLPGPAPAHRQFQEFVSGERMRLFQRLDSRRYFARLNLPPAAVRIVQDSKNPGDLIKVALEFRAEFQKLRGWLGEFQHAIDTEDVNEIAGRRKLFESVVKHVDAITSTSPDGQTSLQFGLSWLKVVTKSGSPINSVRNLFGVRAALNRLILAPPGKKAFGKLLRLFGEGNSKLGRDLERGFMKRSEPM